jgi:hypothetical protein
VDYLCYVIFVYFNREDEVQREYSGVKTLNSGLVEGTRVKGKEEAKVPTLLKQGAWKCADKERAYLALKARGGV